MLGTRLSASFYLCMELFLYKKKKALLVFQQSSFGCCVFTFLKLNHNSLKVLHFLSIIITSNISLTLFLAVFMVIMNLEILNINKIPVVPNALKVIPLLTPMHSLQLLNHYEVLEIIGKIADNVLKRVAQLIECDMLDKVPLQFEMDFFQLLQKTWENFLHLSVVLKKQREKDLLVAIVLILTDLVSRNGGKNDNLSMLTTLNSFVFLFPQSA